MGTSSLGSAQDPAANLRARQSEKFRDRASRGWHCPWFALGFPRASTRQRSRQAMSRTSFGKPEYRLALDYPHITVTRPDAQAQQYSRAARRRCSPISRRLSTEIQAAGARLTVVLPEGEVWRRPAGARRDAAPQPRPHRHAAVPPRRWACRRQRSPSGSAASAATAPGRRRRYGARRWPIPAASWPAPACARPGSPAPASSRVSPRRRASMEHPSLCARGRPLRRRAARSLPPACSPSCSGRTPPSSLPGRSAPSSRRRSQPRSPPLDPRSRILRRARVLPTWSGSPPCPRLRTRSHRPIRLTRPKPSH